MTRFPQLIFSVCAVCFGSSLYAQTLTASGCDYSNADVNGGWGWNQATLESCPPIIETATPAEPTPTEPEENGNCDYTDAALYDGWGWDPVTRTSCAPLTEVSSGGSGGRPFCTSADADADGDGYGWENSKTCLVRTTTTENAGTDNPGTGNPVSGGDRPVCSSASLDPDGDGYGWENDATCIVASGESGGETVSSVELSPSGVINTGKPEYRWPARANADQYRLIVRDAGNNGFTHEIDPVAANCQTGTGACTAQPDTGYFDNFLTWRVEAVVNGATQTVAGPVSFKTPVSADLQPIASNTASCEAYPAMAWDKFVLVNNIWNARAMYRSGWSQTINIEQQHGSAAVPSWKYDWLEESDGGIYDVKSYPEVVYGNKLGVHISGSKAETGLPEKVANLDEFRVDYSFTHEFDAEVNVALESFFHSSCDIAGPCDDIDNRAFEMMIWVQNPTVRTPGDLALTGVMIDNKLWDVYIKPRSNKKYIAFTAQTDQSSGTLNWNRFVDWTVEWTKNNAEELEINQLSTDYCMGAIEIGTEVFNGDGTFTLDSYNITRQ
jgi:hypothetical protein